MDDIKPTPQPSSPQPGRSMDGIGARPPVSRPVSISITDSTDTTPAAPQASSRPSAPEEPVAPSAPSSTSPVPSETASVGPMTPQVIAEEVKESTPELIPGLDTKPDDTISSTSDLPPANPDEVAKNTQTLLEQAAREEKASTESASMSQLVPAKRSKGPAIMVAVILALALAGGAVYAYLLNNKKTVDVPKPPVTTQVTTTEKKADPAKAATTITDTLKKVDDTKDFQEADLTDATLGL
ncbi:MAG: hypothetical protein NTX11_00645 [Candidatus Saccharibacteria bacterium]|nr:hypothetical protein [Candidatus Saccharibacteria bacterium]